jgi:hypothetical protein
MKKSRKNRRVLGFREKDGETIPITAKVRHHISKIVASAKGLNISPRIKQFYGTPSSKIGRRKLTRFDKEAEEAYAKLDRPLLERLKDKTPEELMEWIQHHPDKAEELQRKGIIDEKGVLCVPDWRGLDRD